MQSEQSKSADLADAWYLLSPTCLTLWNRIQLLLGWKLFMRFDSPNGQCSAACKSSWAISHAKYVSQDMDWRWGNNWPNVKTNGKSQIKIKYFDSIYI